jgi:hypothetical protein
MVSDAYHGNLLFQTGPCPELFVQEQPTLPVQLNFAGQRKTDTLESDGLVRSGRRRTYGERYLLEALLRIKAQYAVGAEDEVEIAPVLVSVDLASKLVRDEDSPLIIDNVLVFAC